MKTSISMHIPSSISASANVADFESIIIPTDSAWNPDLTDSTDSMSIASKSQVSLDVPNIFKGIDYVIFSWERKREIFTLIPQFYSLNLRKTFHIFALRKKLHNQCLDCYNSFVLFN